MITKNYLTFDGNLLTFNNVQFYFPQTIVNSGNDSFFFPHVCTIYRSDGQVNDQGDEIFTGLYYGDCAFEFNTSSTTKLQGLTFQSDSFLLLPSTDILFRTNDMVMVETENGRIIKATIEQFETITDSGNEGTTIWLKQGQDG